MLLFPLSAIIITVAAAVSLQSLPMVATLHPELPAQPPDEDRWTCKDSALADEAYIISNPYGRCGPNNLGQRTESATKVGRLCMNMCVCAVNATTGDPAKMYGLSHPRTNGGFFTLFNGTDCERDSMYLEYPAQRVGNGPVRFVQSAHATDKQVSPFMSFLYTNPRLRPSRLDK